MMRQTIAGLALLVGLAGCKPAYQTRNSSNTSVNTTTTIAVPSDCKELIDVRFGYSATTPGSDVDQVVCLDQNGDRVIYIKGLFEDQWSARRYETSKTKNVVESP